MRLAKTMRRTFLIVLICNYFQIHLPLLLERVRVRLIRNRGICLFTVTFSFALIQKNSLRIRDAGKNSSREICLPAGSPDQNSSKIYSTGYELFSKRLFVTFSLERKSNQKVQGKPDRSAHFSMLARGKSL